MTYDTSLSPPSHDTPTHHSGIRAAQPDEYALFTPVVTEGTPTSSSTLSPY
eukprot:m.118905 g.118905  ORF g.118905 m.118905 type:complete len:51 (-) comp21762_c0_seq3:22-174(-)